MTQQHCVKQDVLQCKKDSYVQFLAEGNLKLRTEDWAGKGHTHYCTSSLSQVSQLTHYCVTRIQTRPNFDPDRVNFLMVNQEVDSINLDHKSI